jgi:large repetitive protein
MTDRELEARLEAFYRTEAGDTETAPLALRRDVVAIPRTIPERARWFGRRRPLTLLAAAALLLVGGAMAAGSGLVKLPSLVPPEPAPSLPVAVASPTAGPTISPAPTATPAAVPPRAPSWTATGDMGFSPAWHLAALLPGGTVLMMDAGPRCPDWNTDHTDCNFVTAAQFDPVAGSWTAAQKLVTAVRDGDVRVPMPLPDGRVLLVGCASAIAYDPGTQTLTAAPGGPRGHNYCSVTRLLDGRMLIAGGTNDAGRTVATAGLYDPATGSWAATGSMGTPRQSYSATLLPDGKVLVVGGIDSSGVSASAELYDPAAGTWTSTGSMATPRAGFTATLLPDGRVLVAGGGKSVADKNGSVFVVASAELYDPASGTWTATGSMVTPREGHTATLLPDGRVLVTGGLRSSLKWNEQLVTSADSAELYDPASGTWTRTASMVAPREGHTATLLPAGRVLVAGGIDPHGNTDPSGNGTYKALLTSAELYDPGTGQ